MSFLSNRFIGAILLIVGTSIGAGMLALPIASSGVGFFYSSFLIFACWLVMLLSAFFILEVNLWLPKGSNMVSMAEKTLGITGKACTWLIYVLLLYTLMSAYISGGSDVLQSLLRLININLSLPTSIVLFTLIFAAIVYQGINVVERVNTPLMIVKVTIYILLVIFLVPHINISFLAVQGEWRYLPSALLLLATSFGFAVIIPSLRAQFDDDIKALRNVIFIASLFPLICYLVWNAVIMGVLPRLGDEGLFILNKSDHATTDLTNDLNHVLGNSRIVGLFRSFSAVCMLTAFLGVSLCLFDFLSDSLKLKKKGHSGIGLMVLCFVPPLFIVLFYPGAYIDALSYAGVLVVLLLLLLPALMAYFGRYRVHLRSRRFQVIGGKKTIFFVIVSSIVFLSLIAPY